MSQLDTEGLVKIAWSEFEDCQFLKFISKTAPFYADAKKKYHSSIQILLGRITYMEDRLKKYGEGGPNELPKEKFNLAD